MKIIQEFKKISKISIGIVIQIYKAIIQSEQSKVAIQGLRTDIKKMEEEKLQLVRKINNMKTKIENMPNHRGKDHNNIRMVRMCQKVSA
jgi:hypothetical protein